MEYSLRFLWSNNNSSCYNIAGETRENKVGQSIPPSSSATHTCNDNRIFNGGGDGNLKPKLLRVLAKPNEAFKIERNILMLFLCWAFMKTLYYMGPPIHMHLVQMNPSLALWMLVVVRMQTLMLMRRHQLHTRNSFSRPIFITFPTHAKLVFRFFINKPKLWSAVPDTPLAVRPIPFTHIKLILKMPFNSEWDC